MLEFNNRPPSKLEISPDIRPNNLAVIESLRNWTCCQFWIYLSCWPIPPANFCIALAGRQLSVLFQSRSPRIKWTVSRDFNQLKFIIHSLDVLNSYIYKSLGWILSQILVSDSLIFNPNLSSASQSSGSQFLVAKLVEDDDPQVYEGHGEMTPYFRS